MPLKVVVTDYIEPDLDYERDALAAQGIELEAHQLKFAGEDAIGAATADADVVVVNMAPITPAVAAAWRRCRLVINHGIGYDNINMAALTARGVRLTYIPDYCIEEVAEHTVALLLALGRRVGIGRRLLEDSARAGEWRFEEVASMRRLSGQTVGIIGLGRIGSRVWQLLSGFGLRVLVCDLFLNEAWRGRPGFEPAPLDRLLRESDYVTIHAPLNEQTRHLIGHRTLALMKPTAFIINTARAGLVDQAALVEALAARRIAGAALDVFDPEPPAPDDPLLALDNVVLTPHIAWYSQESAWDIRKKIVEQILRHASGQPPLHWLNEAPLAARTGLSGSGI